MCQWPNRHGVEFDVCREDALAATNNRNAETRLTAAMAPDTINNSVDEGRATNRRTGGLSCCSQAGPMEYSTVLYSKVLIGRLFYVAPQGQQIPAPNKHQVFSSTSGRGVFVYEVHKVHLSPSSKVDSVMQMRSR